jgi:hypothetical protein
VFKPPVIVSMVLWVEKFLVCCRGSRACCGGGGSGGFGLALSRLVLVLFGMGYVICGRAGWQVICGVDGSCGWLVVA